MKRLFVLMSTVAVLTVSPEVKAEGDVAEVTSSARFKEGIAFARQGKYEQARVAFLQTLALEPENSNVLLNLAVAEHALGRWVEALTHLKAYLQNPKLDTKHVQELRQGLYDDLWRVTGHLRIQAPPGVPVTLDGDLKLGNAPLLDIVDVLPGKHAIAAEGRSVDVSVNPGQTLDVSLLHDTSSSSSENSKPTTAEYVYENDNSFTTTRANVWKPLTFVFGGVSVVAAGFALYFNTKSSFAADEASTMRDQEANTSCSGSATAPFCGALRRTLDDQSSAADVATGLWIGAGVAAALSATSAILWATSRTSSGVGSVAPLVGPGLSGATYHVSF